MHIFASFAHKNKYLLSLVGVLLYVIVDIIYVLFISDFVEANTFVRSPQRLFISIIKNSIYRIKVSYKHYRFKI